MGLFDKFDFDAAGGAVQALLGANAAGEAGKLAEKGYQAQASGYREAARISGISGGIAGQASAIQAVQADRDLYKVLGAQRADIGAAGLAASGSALDVIRDSAAQGGLTKQLIGRQSAITSLGYQQEQSSYQAQAAAADASAASAAAQGKAAKKGGLLSGLFKIGKVVAPLVLSSDESLKVDVEPVYRRPDGVGIYRFRYLGQPTVFEGVLAQDVQKVYPEAVTEAADGKLQVDYAAIGVEPKVVRT